MKRTVISIISAIAFYFGYLILAGFIWGFFKLSDRTLEKILFPLDFLRYIYQDLLHLPYPKEIWVYVLDSAIVILMYFAFFYLAFTVFTKIIKRPKMEGIENPPEPPIFESLASKKSIDKP